jgi:hypothetical protein
VKAEIAGARSVIPVVMTSFGKNNSSLCAGTQLTASARDSSIRHIPTSGAAITGDEQPADEASSKEREHRTQDYASRDDQTLRLDWNPAHGVLSISHHLSNIALGTVDEPLGPGSRHLCPSTWQCRPNCLLVA